MSIKAPSIKEQFINRSQHDIFLIQWSHDEDNKPTEVEQFKDEAIIFIQNLKKTERVPILSFKYSFNYSSWFINKIS
eukprot:snap_masked-scaffold_57-processed-gene-1.21-mRNA-1 protein AED:1.00 eAED:1.00 QI:0/0/0/0/1/1/3/0/76